MHVGVHQGEVAMGCLFDWDKGEILIMMGKEKLYESDVEYCSNTEKSKIVKETSMRKSKRVHTDSRN